MPREDFASMQRSLLDGILSNVNKVFSQYDITCFISYAWGGDQDDQSKVVRLKKDLEKAGIKNVFVDLTNNYKTGSSINHFIKKIDQVSHVIVVGSKTLINKYQSNEETSAVIKEEIKLIKNRYDMEVKSNVTKYFAVGLVFSSHYMGNIKDVLPFFLQKQVIGMYTNDFMNYARVTLDLLEYFAPNEKATKEVTMHIAKFDSQLREIQQLFIEQQANELRLINQLALTNLSKDRVEDLLKINYFKKLYSKPSFKFLQSIFSHQSRVPPVSLVYRVDVQSTEKTSQLPTLGYADIIKALQDRSQKLIMIQGDCGIGKSTLCEAITYLWATNKELLDFNFIFYINLENLKNFKYENISGQKCPLIDLVINECFVNPLSIASMAQLKVNMNHEKHKILWIIDSKCYEPEYEPVYAVEYQPELDEYAYSYECEDYYEDYNNNIPKHALDLLRMILMDRDSYCIVTTRFHPKSSSYYQIVGISPEAKKEYVNFFLKSNNYGKDSQIKNSLLHFLRISPFLENLTLIPMYLDIVCSIWLNHFKGNFQEKFNTRITEIYEEIFLNIITKFLIEQENEKPYNKIYVGYAMNSKLRDVLLCLQKISFFAHRKNRDFITIAEFNQHALKILGSYAEDPIIKMLLCKMLQIGFISKKGNNLHFTDPSLKTFFSAKCLINRFVQISRNDRDCLEFIEEFKNFIVTYKYFKLNTLLFAFIFGNSSSFGIIGDTYDNLLYISNFKLFIWHNIMHKNVDFVGINHACLLLTCLKEIVDYKDTLKKFPEIKQFLMLSLPSMLEFVKIYKIANLIKMFLSVFNDPSCIKIIIDLELLENTIDFIVNTEDSYESTILYNLIMNCESQYSNKILDLVEKKLLNITVISNANLFIVKYFAVSIKDNLRNTQILKALLNGNLKNKSTAVVMLSFQKFYNKEVFDLSTKLAITLGQPVILGNKTSYISRTVEADYIKFIIDSTSTCPEVSSEIEEIACGYIDVLIFMYYNSYNSYNTEVISNILKDILYNSTSQRIKQKIANLDLTWSLFHLIAERNIPHHNACDAEQITDKCHLPQVNTLLRDFLNFCASNTENQKQLNTPLIELLRAYASDTENITPGIMIIIRLIFNAYCEGFFIEGNKIKVFDNNSQHDCTIESFELKNSTEFIDKFQSLCKDFSNNTTPFPFYHTYSKYCFNKGPNSSLLFVNSRLATYCFFSNTLSRSPVSQDNTRQSSSVYSDQGISSSSSSSSSPRESVRDSSNKSARPKCIN